MSDSGPRLRLVSGLRLRHEPGAGHALESADRVHAVGPHTLAIVDAFLQPRSLPEAIRLLQARTSGRQDWIDLTAEIVQMRRSGLLLPEDAGNPPAQVENAFSAVPVHIRMLRDRTRTLAYLDAIRASVRPGDVVIDLGSGSGVLAVAAAQAGAARVYAIEASSMGAVAARLATANGVDDRVRVVEGWSTTVDLPERADLLVSEIIGNDPTAERVLECTADAVRRLLKPDARLLPRRLCVLAVPMQLSADLRARVRVDATQLARWRAGYGIDFRPLADFAGSASARLQVQVAELARSRALASAAIVSVHELREASHAPARRECVLEIERSGRLDAIALGFSAELLEGLAISSDPAALRPDNHWRHPIHLLPKPLRVHQGQRLRVQVPGAAEGELRVEAVP